jgi:hypothetical protein
MANTRQRHGLPEWQASDEELVRAFVRRHFSWRGTVRLHRASLGIDLLRAPINVVLAPIFLLVRLAALLLSVLRFRSMANWLASRRILLRSSASRVVERAVTEELLARRTHARTPGPAMSARLVSDYVGIRSSVAEIITTLLVLGTGLIVFRSATPGLFSLAPMVSDLAAFNAAVAGFPLGAGLGRAWYTVFPHELSGWIIGGVAALLVVAAAFVTTFAGLIADPIQAALGIHQRRLLRLLARIDAAEEAGPAIAREHLLARLADISDAAAALLRILRP